MPFETICTPSCLDKLPATRDKKVVYAPVATLVVLACAAAVGLGFFCSLRVLCVALPLLFFTAGMLYAKYLSTAAILPGERLSSTVLSSATILLLLAGANVWLKNMPWTTVGAGAAAFFLPVVWNRLWQHYLLLTVDMSKIWQPANESKVQYPAIYITGMPVCFKISERQDGLAERTVHSRVLAEMKLSEVFFDTVQKQNKKGEGWIDLAPAGQPACCWIFFTTRLFLWKRTLDPALSVVQNGLRKNAVVYALRIENNGFTTFPVNTPQTDESCRHS